jgi:hypothetical protein
MLPGRSNSPGEDVRKEDSTHHGRSDDTEFDRAEVASVDQTDARKQVRAPDKPSRQVNVKVATNAG